MFEPRLLVPIFFRTNILSAFRHSFSACSLTLTRIGPTNRDDYYYFPPFAVESQWSETLN